MENNSVKLRRTNGDVEIFDNSTTPARQNNRVEHIDTDIELVLDGDAGEPYKTPTALQKKKSTIPAPVIESSVDEDFEFELQVEQKKQVAKKNKRPVLDNAARVSHL
jgi:hypothetical protein